jgi:hypothetical protein
MEIFCGIVVWFLSVEHGSKNITVKVIWRIVSSTPRLQLHLENETEIDSRFHSPRTDSGTHSFRPQNKWRHFWRADSAFLGMNTAYTYINNAREWKRRSRIHRDRKTSLARRLKDYWTVALTGGKVMDGLPQRLDELLRIIFALLYDIMTRRPIAK